MFNPRILIIIIRRSHSWRHVRRLLAVTIWSVISNELIAHFYLLHQPSFSLKKTSTHCVYFSRNVSNNDTVIKNGYSIWIFNITSLTLAKQPFNNYYRNPSILVDMVSSNATGDY